MQRATLKTLFWTTAAPPLSACFGLHLLPPHSLPSIALLCVACKCYHSSSLLFFCLRQFIFAIEFLRAESPASRLHHPNALEAYLYDERVQFDATTASTGIRRFYSIDTTPISACTNLDSPSIAPSCTYFPSPPEISVSSSSILEGERKYRLQSSHTNSIYAVIQDHCNKSSDPPSSPEKKPPQELSGF
ncbi:hypothetical protein HYFRA_00001832 [Hymenoscyphus fraxineus]|uniref:Uncharacterized protein n=1 Tax=Hymenoscyphus fraxineus TaxID=746836 RepID=A0A9N9PJK2_9HELO|nr:hypothetical protein HYFRA_00001832 [Hymenoscyphus fraxineus]